LETPARTPVTVGLTAGRAGAACAAAGISATDMVATIAIDVAETPKVRVQLM
jgi:hypothetical protein